MEPNTKERLSAIEYLLAQITASGALTSNDPIAYLSATKAVAERRFHNHAGTMDNYNRMMDSAIASVEHALTHQD